MFILVCGFGEKDNCDKRHVSFNNEPEIRYRTASEASSNSTFRGNVNATKKNISNKDTRCNIKHRTYSSRALQINQHNSPISETEMSFDRLLNSNCSWSYRTMKTVTLEARNGNNPIFKLQNTNITENCIENDRDSSLNSATNNRDVNESEKSIFIDSAEEKEGLNGLECVPDSPYDCIHPEETELISNGEKKINMIHKSKASTKTSLKNTGRKSYVRSGVPNINTTDESIKSLKKTVRKSAAKSVVKSIKCQARVKKSLQNTECKISTCSDVDTSNARVEKTLNNEEHEMNAGSDSDSADTSDSGIKISLRNSYRKSSAQPNTTPIDTSEAKVERVLPNTDRKSYAESDAGNIDKFNARIEKALKDAEYKGYAGSDLESVELSDSSIVPSLKKTSCKSSTKPNAKSKDMSDAGAKKALKNTDLKSCAGSDLETVAKVDASIKNSLKNADRKRYTELDIETDAYSSSEEEAVLQTRICNEEGKAISNVPVDNSNPAGEHVESVLDCNDNINNLCFDNSDHINLKNELCKAFDKSLEKPENKVILIDDNDSIVKPQVLNCQESDQLEKSFSKKRNPKRKFDAENSSFELSSLSEVGDANDDIVNVFYSSSSSEMKMHSERKTDSEMIQKCLDISTEVHSMCETMESGETSVLDEIVHDFFNGTLDVRKYEKNKISPTASQERYKTIQNGEKTKILNRDKETNLSVPRTPDSFIINTDSDYGEVSESPVKSVRRKSLKTKQSPVKELKNARKRTPNSLKSSSNSFNDKQKNKELSAKRENTNQSSNRKLTIKIRSEDALFHKNQDLEKSVKYNEYEKKDELTTSYSLERPFFVESIEMPKTENSLKRKSTNRNVREGNFSRVKQLSNEVSASIDTNYEKRDTYKQLINTEESKPPEIVKTSTTKRPKTWDDLENIYSEETICHTNTLTRCQDEPILISKKSACFDEPVASFAEITNKCNTKARLQTHNEKEYPALPSSPQNQSGAKNQMATMTPKNSSKRNDELALVSPNEKIIDKIMKNMEKCTQPYLNSSKKKQKTFLNDLEQTKDSNKSPIVAEYSYSIKEIQSTILVTSGKTKKIRNVLHRDETKSQFCKVEQLKSLPNKNDQVRKQEAAFKSWSLLKDNCDDNSFNKINFNTPRRTPNQLLNNKENGSNDNIKPNVLNNILARLDVGDYRHDNGRDNNCADGKQMKFLTHKNKETPDLESSNSTINTFRVEQGHYNLRKRKSKNYFDELESNQNNKNLNDYAQYGSEKVDRVASHNSSNSKLRIDWNDGNTDGTDSSCEIIDTLELKRDEREIGRNRKSFEVGKSKTLNTKPENSHKFLDKRKSAKKQLTLLPTSSMLSKNSDESDSEGTIYDLNDIKTREINNKSRRNSKRYLLPKEDILEKSSSESGWENCDYHERNYPQAKISQNKSHLKVADNRNSKSNLNCNTKSNNVSNEKKQTSFMPYQNSPKSNDAANFDGKKKLARSVEKTTNMLKNKKEFLTTEVSPKCSNKSPSKRPRDLLFGKEQNQRFAQETKKSDPNLKIRSPKKMSEKCNNEDSYKKYLETIFKNSNKTSSRNQVQKISGNTLSAGSDEDEFFSLSSSDSDDFEASTPKPRLGLCGDVLSEESG